MIVAVQTWDLHLPGCLSLKDKRGVLKPLTNGLRRTLNVSVAETGHQELWQRAELGVVAISTTTEHVEQVLATAADEIDRVEPGLVTRTEIEFMT